MSPLNNKSKDVIAMLYCCGFGHREVFKNIEKELYNTVIKLIAESSVTVFYTGGNGEFDMQFASAVRRAQKTYSEVKLYLVKPYMMAALNKDKEFYEEYYSGIIIPQELMGCHPKGAITKRNRWMVENSDYVIAYVPRGFGGAYSAVKQAEKLNKTVIHL